MMADSGMTEGAGIIVKLPAKSSSSTEVFSSIDFSSNDRLDLLLPVPEEHAMSDYRTKMHDDYKVDDDDDGKSQDSNDEENSAHLMEKKYRELMLVENQLNQSGNNDTTSGGGDNQKTFMSYTDQLKHEKTLEIIKKSRRLYVALEKEKNKSHLLLRRIHELESLNGLGQSSSLAGISTTAVAGSTVIKSPPNTAVTFNKQSQLENADAEAQNAIKQLRDKVGQLTRKWEEERTQTHLLKQELRQTQRALVLETGDEEITLQKILSSPTGGWKGRAQQITALKDKIIRLSTQLLNEQQRHALPGQFIPQQQQSEYPTFSLVDKQDGVLVQQGIAEKQLHRQVFQQATAEAEEYKAKYESLSVKHQTLKGRSNVLEDQVKELRHQIGVLMEKNDIDDQMITSLKSHIARLQVRGEPKSIPLERDFEDRENYMKKIRELLKEMEEHRDKIRSRSEKYDSENLIAILNAENAMLWEMQRQLEARLENSESLNKKLAGDLYKEKHKILPPANVKSSVPIKDEVQLKMQRRLDLQADEIQSLKSTIEVLTDQKNQELKYYQQLVHNLKRQTSLAKS